MAIWRRYDPKPKNHFSLSEPWQSPTDGQTAAQKQRAQQDAKVKAAVKAAEAEAAKQKKKNSIVEPSYTYASPGKHSCGADASQHWFELHSTYLWCMQFRNA